jgi:hypothetical protein
MFQVVVQATVSLFKSKKLRLSAPLKKTSDRDKKYQSKDKTGFILILMVGGGILLTAIFSNLSSGLIFPR